MDGKTNRSTSRHSSEPPGDTERVVEPDREDIEKGLANFLQIYGTMTRTGAKSSSNKIPLQNCQVEAPNKKLTNHEQLQQYDRIMPITNYPVTRSATLPTQQTYTYKQIPKLERFRANSEHMIQNYDRRGKKQDFESSNHLKDAPDKVHPELKKIEKKRKEEKKKKNRRKSKCCRRMFSKLFFLFRCTKIFGFIGGIIIAAIFFWWGIKMWITYAIGAAITLISEVFRYFVEWLMEPIKFLTKIVSMLSKMGLNYLKQLLGCENLLRNFLSGLGGAFAGLAAGVIGAATGYFSFLTGLAWGAGIGLALGASLAALYGCIKNSNGGESTDEDQGDDDNDGVMDAHEFFTEVIFALLDLLADLILALFIYKTYDFGKQIWVDIVDAGIIDCYKSLGNILEGARNRTNY